MQVERGIINLAGAKVQYSRDKQKNSGVSGCGLGGSFLIDRHGGEGWGVAAGGGVCCISRLGGLDFFFLLSLSRTHFPFARSIEVSCCKRRRRKFMIGYMPWILCSLAP